MPPPLLDVSVSVDYPGKPGVLRDVSLRVESGEIVGLVGQSGSGKSTLALTVLQLLDFKGGVCRGSVRLEGRDLCRAGEREMRKIRGREVALVQQSPLSSLNPALRIGVQLNEAWRVHERGSREAGRKRIAESLDEVSLPSDGEFLRRYPRQLSVGQAQRVLIAMAILHRPALLIADEPTSALDAITQAEVLELFAKLNQRFHVAILFISHDLLSVASLCRRIAIMHEGKIVECAASSEILSHPVHPYSRRLIAALPRALSDLATAEDVSGSPSSATPSVMKQEAVIAGERERSG